MSVPDASSDDQEGKVESLEAVSDPDANVDNNVTPNDDESVHTEQDSGSPPSPPPPPTRPPTMMPLLTNLADLALHSPSSMIVGTPFSDANATRFEYPFPDKSSTSSSPELPMSTSPHHSPAFSNFSPSPSSSGIGSASQPQLVLNAPPLQHFPASFPPPADLPNYSPTHPKLRTVDPPVPPALVKRRLRWTLGLGSLSRRISMRTGSAPTGSVSPGTPDSEMGHRRAMSDELASGSKVTTSNPVGEAGPSAAKDATDDVGRHT
ncbi:hypothetical protein B0H15DRAFT_954841 [Mycena belliarum]|uniref:Uncharacterized protein n=1 Tax=Mycena belliarum TaxID=1033014 RepID=A0AAD6TUG8_9AGAR|nr:hypothetical protein B0H15DRAFT_954841 [Mycena belliae]